VTDDEEGEEGEEQDIGVDDEWNLAIRSLMPRFGCGNASDVTVPLGGDKQIFDWLHDLSSNSKYFVPNFSQYVATWSIHMGILTNFVGEVSKFNPMAHNIWVSHWAVDDCTRMFQPLFLKNCKDEYPPHPILNPSYLQRVCQSQISWKQPFHSRFKCSNLFLPCHASWKASLIHQFRIYFSSWPPTQNFWGTFAVMQGRLCSMECAQLRTGHAMTFCDTWILVFLAWSSQCLYA
jgi:hypothetical protein